MMKRILLSLILLLPLFLNGVKVTAAVNKTQLSTADRLEYTIKISNDGSINLSEPAAPQIELFSFLGMNSSSSSSTTFSGLKATTHHTRTYTYTYLPLKTGTTTIPAQQIKIANQIHSTTPIQVSVVQSQTSPPAQSSPWVRNPFGYQDPDLFLTPGSMTGSTLLLAVPESRRVFKGEPVIVSYYLYTDQMVRSFNMEDEKDFPGYGKSIFTQPTNLEYENTTLSGKRYQRALLKRLALSPNTTGTIQTPVLSGTARIYSFGYLSQGVSSTPVNIEVMPLPRDNVPDSFTGAVGSFEVSGNVSSEELSLGEAITFTLRIKGRGNFNQFGNPAFPETPAQVSSPVTVDKLNAGIEGVRTLYYTIIPHDKGVYTLPGLSFSWFDPSSGSYRTYKSDAAQISVKSANVISYFSGLLDGSAPRSLQPMIARNAYHDYRSYLNMPWYWIIVAVILLMLIISGIKAFDKLQQRNNPIKYASKEADRALQKYLKEASAAAQELSPAFYPLAEKGLMQYLTEKYGISNHLSNPDKIASLRDLGIEEDVLKRTADFLELCARARFMPPESSATNLAADLSALRQIVASFSKLREANHA